MERFGMSIKQKIVKFNNFFVSAYKDLRGGGKKGNNVLSLQSKERKRKKGGGFSAFLAALGMLRVSDGNARMKNLYSHLPLSGRCVRPAAPFRVLAASPLGSASVGHGAQYAPAHAA